MADPIASMFFAIKTADVDNVTPTESSTSASLPSRNS